MRRVDPIFAARKDRRDLRIETLCNAIPDGARNSGRKPRGPARVDEFDRVVVDRDPRRNIAKREVAMNEYIYYCLRNGIKMIRAALANYRIADQGETFFGSLF